MDAIATIVELVREVVEPVIEAPFELVDIEYGKIGSDMILSIFVDKPEGITLNDTADLTEIISPCPRHYQARSLPEQYFLEITSPGLERPLKPRMPSLERLGNTSMSGSTKPSISKRSLKEPCWPLKRMS